MKLTRPTIMAPVGSFESLMAAINAGADAVYFGIDKLNMRSRSAKKFSLEDLKKISDICKEHQVKTYLTLNIVMYDDDLELMREICRAAKDADITSIIACDFSVIQYARSVGLRVHISTQANISNFEAVKYFSKFSDVIVLARELSLEQVKRIGEQIREKNVRGPSGELVQIEVFVHGALCVSISGKCYMSLALYNQSANRGACIQPCRRNYRVYDEETDKELVIENGYVMSPKDICTLRMIDKLIEAGVSVFKIEGRGRSPDYVDVVTRVYKEATESVIAGTYTPQQCDAWEKRLTSVFHRGFWHNGYYLGKKLGEWSGTYGSQATVTKEFIGIVSNYYVKARVCEVRMQASKLRTGDSILITGPTTGVVRTTLHMMRKEDQEVDCARKGSTVTFSLPQKVRKNDKIYVLTEKWREAKRLETLDVS